MHTRALRENRLFSDRRQCGGSSVWVHMNMAVPNEFDPELPVIDAIRSGDRDAFGELVRRHDQWVRGVIFGVLGDHDRVDDAASEAWAAAWRRIKELRDITRWRPWLYRIARNAAIDAGRDLTRRRRHQSQRELDMATVETASFEKAGDQRPGDSAVNGEQHGEVLSAIEELPALYREPFVLRHLNGWSYAEISDAMRIPVDTVETRLVRARRKLRDSLGHMLG